MTYENIACATKMLNLLGNNFGSANRGTLITNIMFPLPCFLVGQKLKSFILSLAAVKEYSLRCWLSRRLVNLFFILYTLYLSIIIIIDIA